MHSDQETGYTVRGWGNGNGGGCEPIYPSCTYYIINSDGSPTTPPYFNISALQGPQISLSSSNEQRTINKLRFPIDRAWWGVKLWTYLSANTPDDHNVDFVLQFLDASYFNAFDMSSPPLWESQPPIPDDPTGEARFKINVQATTSNMEQEFNFFRFVPFPVSGFIIYMVSHIDLSVGVPKGYAIGTPRGGSQDTNIIIMPRPQPGVVVNTRASAGGVKTITTKNAHGLLPDDRIRVYGVGSSYDSQTGGPYGTSAIDFTVSSTPGANTFTYSTSVTETEAVINSSGLIEIL